MLKSSRPVLILLLLGLWLFLTACEVLWPTHSPSVGTLPGQPARALPAWLTLYFTNPDQAGAAEDMQQAVMDALDGARSSIDVASFDFNLPGVVNALVRARQRGVQVHVVLDLVNGSYELRASDTADKKPFNALKTLRAAGIRVVDGGRSNGLMHDKIIIVDGVTLFVGSWNLSYNDTFRNDNNLLKITAPEILANYQAKFNELYVQRRFGANAEVGAFHPKLNVEGVTVENYFSPPDEVMDKLVDYIRNAQHSIRFLAFTYTHPALAQAMLERARAGVQVQGVIENRSTFAPLFCSGLPVRRDGNRYTMHHKVIILDDHTVITGSFNFTEAADRSNDDHILVIHDPAVAGYYLREFKRVYSLGEEPDPADISCN